MNKELAYEVAKTVPVDVFESLRSEKTPNGMDGVCSELVNSYLPGWLYYAIKYTDKEFKQFDEKLPRYVGSETIVDVAEKHATSESKIINLNTPAEQNWNNSDRLKELQKELENNREKARTSITESLYDVFLTIDYLDADESLCSEWADAIVDSTDMLSWELTKKEFTNKNPSNREIAQIYVRTLSGTEVGMAYLDGKNAEELYFKDYCTKSVDIARDFTDAINALEYTETSGFSPDLHNVLPRDEARLEEEKQIRRVQRENSPIQFK